MQELLALSYAVPMLHLSKMDCRRLKGPARALQKVKIPRSQENSSALRRIVERLDRSSLGLFEL